MYLMYGDPPQERRRRTEEERREERMYLMYGDPPHNLGDPPRFKLVPSLRKKTANDGSSKLKIFIAI